MNDMLYIIKNKTMITNLFYQNKCQALSFQKPESEKILYFSVPLFLLARNFFMPP